MSQNLIAAIEIGSQQISAIIGRKEPDGAINVIAAEQEASAKFVQRGRVFNPDLMTQCLRTLITKLENTAHKSVNQVYVGVGGIGLRTVSNPVTRNYGEPTKITQEIIDSILDENLSLNIPEYSILDVLPLEYKLDTQSLNDPVGVMSNKVVGNFLDIIIPKRSQEQLHTSFQAAKLPIVETVVTPMRLANVTLTDAERLSGCCFIDMGAQSTTISIYEGKLLRFLAVLPLGGDNVTRDLMNTLSIEEQEAEDIKRRYGQAFIDANDSNTAHDNIRLQDGRSISYDEVQDIIEARMSEIIQNVAYLIKTEANFSPDRLIGGLIVTGGASNMSAVDKALIEYTHIRKIRFVKNVPLSVRHSKIQNFNIDGTYNSVLAIVESATAECCSDERKDPDIFTEPQGPTPEEQAAAEAERLKQEEEERLKAEQAAAAAAAAAEKRKAHINGFKRWIKKASQSIEDIFTEKDEDEEFDKE